MTATTRVEVPDGSLFGPAALPYGVFSPPSGPPRVGVRLADHVVDLAVLLDDPVLAEASLNGFMARGRPRWAQVRDDVEAAVEGPLRADAVHRLDDVRLHLPFEVADYVDFYASRHHAGNVGRIFRPDDEPLLPNWWHLPVGYHGRAGTVVVSGTDVVRPCGQWLEAGETEPAFGPTQRLDLEAEVGFVVGTPSQPGSPIDVDDVAEHVFGVVLVDDWSARDVQAFESRPLGPHLGKSFATSVSAWVLPLAALDAARVDLPPRATPVLPHLAGAGAWGLDLDLEVRWNGEVVSRPPYREMSWSPAQMLAHLTSGGAAARTGDLFASGTVSGPRRDQRGCLLELTWGGTEPVVVGGRSSTFLADGDEVVVTATAPAVGGGRLALGEVRGRVLPAQVQG